MPVVSVKIDDDTKEKMAEYKDTVDWPEEIRRFIATSIDQIRRKENMDKVDGLLRGMDDLPKGSSSKLVREDRDSGH
jgi:hypothetical protein